MPFVSSIIPKMVILDWSLKRKMVVLMIEERRGPFLSYKINKLVVSLCQRPGATLFLGI